MVDKASFNELDVCRNIENTVTFFMGFGFMNDIYRLIL
jgi:hypothetical protein